MPRKSNRSKRTKAKNEHLRSRVEGTITLKTQHKKRERYPITISDVFNQDTVGADTDIHLIGYFILLQFATGNQTQTVSCNLGHSGEWVRQSTNNDGFNQQFETRSLRRNSISFSKRILALSERQFLSPHKSPDSSIVLQVDDPCGVIPGVTVKYTVTLHFIRRHIPTKLIDADMPATDLYEDQDVSSGGAQPAPPATAQDLPKFIYDAGIGPFTRINSQSPYIYRDGGSTNAGTYTITVTGGNVNFVGEFRPRTNDIQAEYAKDGFSGTIAYRQ